MKSIKYGLPLIAALALGFGVATTIKLNPKAEVTQPVYQPSGPNSTGSRLYGSGIIEPRDGTVSVSSPLSGTVSQVNVVAGQKVLKGAPLFSLDNREILDDVKIRRAALDVKKAELDRMKAGSHPDEIRAAEKRQEANRRRGGRTHTAGSSGGSRSPWPHRRSLALTLRSDGTLYNAEERLLRASPRTAGHEGTHGDL